MKTPWHFDEREDPLLSPQHELDGRGSGSRLTRGHLEAIVWVSQARSIHSAALRFNEHQPLLSKRLAEAEQILGMGLFIRSRAGCTPRPEAKNIISRAARILRELRSLERPDESGPKRIRLGCIPRVMHTLFPGFMQAAAQAEAPIRLQAIELSSSELFEEVTVFVVDANNRQVKSSVDLETLLEQPFILPAYTTSTRRAFERLVLNEQLTPPVPIIETKSFESSLALLQGSPCVTLVPEPVAIRYEAMGQIRRVKTNRQLEPVGICLFYRFDQTFDPVMRQLEKLISSFLGLPVRRSLSSVAKRSKKA